MASPRRQSRGAARGVAALRKRAVHGVRAIYEMGLSSGSVGGWSMAGDSSGEQLLGYIVGDDGGEVGGSRGVSAALLVVVLLLATLAPGHAASGAEMGARPALGTTIWTRVKVGKKQIYARDADGWWRMLVLCLGIHGEGVGLGIDGGVFLCHEASSVPRTSSRLRCHRGPDRGRKRDWRTTGRSRSGGK